MEREGQRGREGGEGERERERGEREREREKGERKRERERERVRERETETERENIRGRTALDYLGYKQYCSDLSNPTCLFDHPLCQLPWKHSLGQYPDR